jgi:predicted dehydrogenase
MVLLGLNFGLGIARHILRDVPEIRLVGLCDQDSAKLRTVSAELGIRAYESLDEVLSDPEIEAVGLFTGPLGRAQLIKRVLQAGRHVMTTKPFETDVPEAVHVLEEARERGLVVHLNSPAPVLSDDLLQIHSWVETHGLGRPISLQARTWARYREQANGTWYDDPKLCPVAPILRLGIYFLNDFAPLMGVPRRVHVMQSRLFTGRPTVDHAQASIEFENGSTASVLASFCIEDGKPYQDEVTVNYEKGTIRRRMERKKAPDMSQDLAVLELETPTQTLRAETRPSHYAGWYEWKSFQEAVRGVPGAPRLNPDGILYGLRLLEAIRRSAESGLPENVS